MAPPSDAPAMPQRQSCDRCHKQKLRCTNKNSNNGSVCDRCFRKRAQCIYSSSLPKGRPKRTGTSGGNQSSSSTSSMAVSLASPSPSALATKQDAFGAGVPPTAQTPSPGGTTNLTLGDDLAQMFDECFVRRNSSRLDIYQDSIMSFQLRAEQSSSSVPSGQSSTYSRLSHESVLSFLMLDMVEMLLRICSDLECRESYIAHDRNYSASLFADCTPTMFDTQSEHDPEVPELPERHCIIQLIDMWFSVHPFSPIISKSLLIAQFDDGTIDEALLAIILAGTAQTYQNTILPDNGGTDSAEVLARLAATQLRDRLLSSVDPGSFSISTIQTMVLLAWRDFCVGRIRRAVCLAAYTCRIIQRLNASPRKEGRDNREILGGVAIHMVENEILQNIGWLCLATSTWAFIQIDQPFPLLSPEQLPDLPCLDEAKSAMFRLDRATNNISTLPAQVQAMQRLFPLSYITSTVAHIYTFYLNAPVNYGTTTEASSWQTRHIQRLHRLRVASYDPSMLSSEIRAILSATILAVETEVTYIPSQCLLSLTYHTISMHMLFPRKQTDATTQSYQIPFSVLNAFCEEVSAIVAISRRLLSFTSSPMSAQNLGLANSAGMLALSLDSCSKALVHIYCDFEHRPSSEREGTLDISKRFANYAGELHQISQEVVTLHIGSAARLSKKRLKRMKLAFQSFGSSPGSRSTESYLSGEANDHSIFSNHHDQSEIDILLDSQFGITNPSAMQFDQSISGSQEDIMPFDPASMLQNFDISMMRSLLDTPNNYQGM